ncbi:ammonium transporter [Coemansia sp. RSA 552]|nr:ammonium transporter [Coemansia sp. RSA 552]
MDNLVKRDATDTSHIDPGDTAWILISASLVFLMSPGVGYFYSGMARSKNAVSMVFLCMIAMAVVSVQWMIWGYSLALSDTATNPFIGNLRYGLMLKVSNEPHANAPSIPGSVYAIFQCMFAALTPALALGGAAERIRVLPVILFCFIWSTLVYDPIAYWSWAPSGWMAKMGELDYAGGTPVHIASGFAALAFALVLGKRKGFGQEKFEPHNYLNIILGTTLLWFGWFGFNGGSAVASNGRAGMAAVVTHIAACMGGVTWSVIAYFRNDFKFSSFHFCSGAVAGLVTITPASGFVSPWAALVFGAVGGIACHFAVDLKEKLKFDDALDVFAVHGVGGIVGNLLTGIFASKSVAALNGAEIDGGWIDHHWKQLGYQLAGSCAGAAWAFGITAIILYVFNIIPGLRLRIDEEGEISGTDITEMGEHGYKFATIEPPPNAARDSSSLRDLEQGTINNSGSNVSNTIEKQTISGM